MCLFFNTIAEFAYFKVSDWSFIQASKYAINKIEVYPAFLPNEKIRQAIKYTYILCACSETFAAKNIMLREIIHLQIFIFIVPSKKSSFFDFGTKLPKSN